MRILNVHRRAYLAEPSALAPFIDRLGSAEDRLWPRDRWPAMVLEAGLACGSAGGHGPIRYVVQRYDPGKLVTFRFTRPKGWTGIHGFEVDMLPDGRARLSHVLDMDASALGVVQWLLVFRPLHDALVEDALDRPSRTFGGPAEAPPWSVRVRFLRWVFSA